MEAPVVEVATPERNVGGLRESLYLGRGDLLESIRKGAALRFTQGLKARVSARMTGQAVDAWEVQAELKRRSLKQRLNRRWP